MKGQEHFQTEANGSEPLKNKTGKNGSLGTLPVFNDYL